MKAFSTTARIIFNHNDGEDNSTSSNFEPQRRKDSKLHKGQLLYLFFIIHYSFLHQPTTETNYIFTNSTLRFFALPSSVVFSDTGFVCPHPFEVSLVLLIPFATK